MLPYTCLWLHAHTCCQAEVIGAIASGSYCCVSLQKSGSALRPQTKAIFLILVVTSAAMFSAVQGTLGLSLSGSDLPALHTVHLQASAWSGAWSLGSPNMLHASAWVRSKNGKDGLVSFWGVCVKTGCALFSGVLIICKSR